MTSISSSTDVRADAEAILAERSASTRAQAEAVLVDISQEIGVDLDDLAALVVEAGAAARGPARSPER
jgi:hypothetical protein